MSPDVLPRTTTSLLAAIAVILGCGTPPPELGRDGAAAARDDASRPTDAAAADTPDGGSIAREPFRPELEPNRWVRVRDDLPTSAWETGIAYEPRLGALVQHGGHIQGSYAQSPYTSRYSVRADTFDESLAPLRPMRRCITEVAWLDGPERIATVHGGASHGTLPAGSLRSWQITRSDANGPWLYDALADRWEHARPSGTSWPRRTHANIAYDATSDALFVVGGDGLYAYVPHANVVRRLPMPEALNGRRGYGMAFDPDTRRLVIFGGASRLWSYGRIDGDETDNCNVVDAETCAGYYRDFVHSDTWVLDVGAASRAGWADATEGTLPAGWRRVETEAHPPRGMPTWGHSRLQLVYHPPTGRMLLLQHAIDDTPIQDASAWPPITMWQFDPARETWSVIDTVEPPHFAGLAAYAEHEDLLVVWGGGRTGEARTEDTRPMTSRVLYAVRPQVPAAELRAPAPLARIAVRSIEAGVEVRFPAVAGATYEIARAPATPLAGAYETVATVRAAGSELVWVDATAGSDAHAYRARPEGDARWSLPAFDTPDRPSGLTAIVHGTEEVHLAWDRSPREDVTAYRVYRSGPGETRALVYEGADVAHVDTRVDLSDGLARAYSVTAVDRAGRESGGSPAAFTLADAPASLSARDRGDGTFELRWAPRDAAHERLEVHYLDYHCNARSSIEIFLDTFAPVSDAPLSGETIVVRPPVIDPEARERAPRAEPGECGRTLRDGHFFYARVVNAIGQPGFYSDIVSPTDARFRAAVVETD